MTVLRQVNAIRNRPALAERRRFADPNLPSLRVGL
jgi:hypothetical protein